MRVLSRCQKKRIWHNTHTHTHARELPFICLYLPFVIKRKTTIHAKCTNKAFKQKVKVQFGLRPNTTLRPLVVLLHRWRKQQQHSLFQLAALCSGCAATQAEWEREGAGGQSQAANKQNKCVFAVRGPTNEQNNKTQSLNAKQVFLVCSFPPPWPKPKAQARHSHRPHTYIDMHTHTHIYGARKQRLKTKQRQQLSLLL